MTNHRTLFTYGILRDRKTVSDVIGHAYLGEMVAAILPDHIVVRDLGPAYVFAAPGQNVHGVLLYGLSDADFVPLDQLEGTRRGHYDRLVCTVETSVGPVQTEFYRGGKAAEAKYTIRLATGRSEASGDNEWPPIGDAYMHETPPYRRSYGAFLDEMIDAGELSEDEAYELQAVEEAEEHASGSAALLEAADEIADEYFALPDTPKRKHSKVVPFKPVYPGTPGHLPSRRGIPLDKTLRTGATPKGARFSLFVFDDLRSLDRLEMVINREWFGRRTSARVTGMQTVGTFPRFAKASAKAESVIEGHLLDGLSEADLLAIDRHMNVASKFHERVEVQFGKRPAFMYVAGAKADDLIDKAKSRARLARRARRESNKRREREAVLAKSYPTRAWSRIGGHDAADYGDFGHWPVSTQTSKTYIPGEGRSLIPVNGGKAIVSWKPNT